MGVWGRGQRVGMVGGMGKEDLFFFWNIRKRDCKNKSRRKCRTQECSVRVNELEKPCSMMPLSKEPPPNM